MSPEECIAALDNALAEAGEDVVLRRLVGQGNNTAPIDVTCRATVRAYRLREEEIAAGISQAVQLVTISPTPIAKAQWPGGQPAGQAAPFDVDPSIPRRNDKVIIQGRMRNVEAVEPIKVDGVLVRINMQVVG